MATIRLSNAGGAWGTGATWDGGVAPGAGDDVTADSLSGNLSIATAVACHSFNFANGSNWAGTLTVSGTRTWTVGGGVTLTSLSTNTLSSAMTFTGGGVFTLQLDNRSGGLTWTSNGVTMNGITTLNIDANVAASVTATFLDTTNVGAAAVVMRRGGCTITSGKTFTTTGTTSLTGTAGTFVFTYSGATLSTGTWTNSSTNTVTITGNSTSNLTCTALNSVFTGKASSSYPGTVTINGGGLAQIVSTCTFVNLFLIGTAATTDRVAITTAQTITGEFRATGNTTNNLLTVVSDVYGTSRTLTVTGATVNAQSNVRFRDITMSGATASGTAVGDCGGNSGITVTSPKTSYMSNVGGTSNWNDNIWASSSNGATNISNYPLPQDTAILDTHSFTGNGITVTLSDPHVSIIDASLCTTNTHVLSANNLAQGVSYYGNITFATNGNTTWAAAVGTTHIMSKRGTQTFTMNGAPQSVGGVNAVQVQNIGGTFQTTDNFTWGANNTSSGITLINGTFAPQGNVTIPAITDSGTATKAFTGIAGKTITFPTSPANLFNVQASGSTSTPNGMNLAFTDASAGLKTANLGTSTSQVWGDITVTPGGAGALKLLGTYTANSMSMNAAGTKSITFSNGGTVVLTLPTFFKGSAGNLITIISDSAGVAFTLSCTKTITTDYISLKDSTASGTAVIPFYAGSHSTNVSGNTNWNFSQWPSSEPTSKYLPLLPMYRNRFYSPVGSTAVAAAVVVVQVPQMLMMGVG